MLERLLVSFLWYIKRTFIFSFGYISIMAEWKTVAPANWKQYKCDHEISISDSFKYKIKTKETITGVSLSWGGSVVPTFFWERKCPHCNIEMSSSGYYGHKELNRKYKPEGDKQWPIYPETGEKIPQKVEDF